jgi:hypothetical protein
MMNYYFRRFARCLLFILICSALPPAPAQVSRQITTLPDANHDRVSQGPEQGNEEDHEKERDAWFYRGRIMPGKNSAELRHRAYQAKIAMRRARADAAARNNAAIAPATLSGSWTPLGPVPLASDASGMDIQNYNQVSGRATAVAIDPADPTGNTVYIGGAQGGVWQSTTAVNPTANSVGWSTLTDDQATLSVGSIAIQPGNSVPSQSVILVATGEADNTSDSYYGLGILVSTNAGGSWTLVSTANSGALSFSGLGGTRMAFNTTTGQTNTVVSAMATANEGVDSAALTASAVPGLYSSTNAGQRWNYDALLDPGNQPTDATSATSVVYNAGAGLFFAAVRYHGFYSSPDGMNWTRLASQPSTQLTTAACPPTSSSNNFACPIYRAEIAAVPGRNEMYVWIISLDAFGNPVDGGIWQSLDSGSSWTEIVDTGIVNCGDSEGCGVEQGYYNLELMAMPNGSATDLYAGAINLYKCSISSLNPTCNTAGFLNLTHVYGCDPIAAPSHVHPDQHALAYAIPTSGSDNGAGLIYFANDGGIYRALNGFTGLNNGSCSGTNGFDDLNQNLGSMTQFVSFSQHPTDPNTLLGGTQDNGSPATSTALTSLSWGNVNGGDGGYNAIDPNAPSNWFTSNPDVPPGGLNIQECSLGANCFAQDFNVVLGSNNLGGDDGAFYFPYVLDPQSSSTLVVGTCRVWRGPRLGGTYTVLSPNFDTLGTGTCSGDEVNQVLSLAAGGPTDGNGSQVIYATTDGPGPLLTTNSPSGGNVWVTANATTTPLTQVTQSINPNQFPVSSVAIDTSDPTGNTAYVTIMGFTAPAGSTSASGHIWRTTSAGATWTDFTGAGGPSPLPDAPANAVVVLPGTNTTPSTIFVGTDVGVFVGSSTTPSWAEVGPNPSTDQSGFLPNVAVTALAIFSSGSQQFLRASTYGRGVWQFNLNPTPDFQLTVSPPTQTVPLGQAATFTGAVTLINGYNNSITLSCVAGTTLPPKTCLLTPSVVQPGTTAFTLSASDVAGQYSFNVQGIGSDPANLTHQTPVGLGIETSIPDFVLSEPASLPIVKAGSVTTGGTTEIMGINNFNGTVSLSCSVSSGGGSCTVLPPTQVSLSTIQASGSVTVAINATGVIAGSYTLSVQGTSGATAHTLAVPFTVSDYQLTGTPSLTIAPGSQGTANVTITPVDSYAGTLLATCNVSALSLGSCFWGTSNLSQVSVPVNSASSIPLTVTIGAGSTPAGTYDVNINTQDVSVGDNNGQPVHNLSIAVTVPPADFTVTNATPAQTITAGQTTGPYQIIVAPNPPGSSFQGAVSLSCSSGLPSGAQCNFTPSTPQTLGSTAVNAVMTISTSATTATGSYSITVSGTAAGGSPSHPTTVQLIVSAPPSIDFTMTANPSSGSDQAGSPATVSLTLTSTASTSIQVTCDDTSLPGAQGCSVFNPSSPLTVNPGAPIPFTASINVPTNATPANYNILFNAQDATGSQTVTFVLTILPSFSLTNATPTQTITAGQTTGAYQLSIAPNPPGSPFQGAVTLACGFGLPPGAQCIFNPSTPQTPGSTAVNVVMTISTTAATSMLSMPGKRPAYLYAFGLLLPGIVIAWGTARRNQSHSRKSILLAILFLVAICQTSCGGGSSSPNTSSTTQLTTAGNYTITVTGTAGSLSSSTNVGLIVEAP